MEFSAVTGPQAVDSSLQDEHLVMTVSVPTTRKSSAAASCSRCSKQRTSDCRGCGKPVTRISFLLQDAQACVSPTTAKRVGRPGAGKVAKPWIGRASNSL